MYVLQKNVYGSMNYIQHGRFTKYLHRTWHRFWIALRTGFGFGDEKRILNRRLCSLRIEGQSLDVKDSILL